MVFVHSRKDTTKTAQDLLDIAIEKGMEELFSAEVQNGANSDWARKEIAKSRNQDVKRLFLAGFACHHAGMLRADRNLVEKMFHQGLIKVSEQFWFVIVHDKKKGSLLHGNARMGCQSSLQASDHKGFFLSFFLFRYVLICFQGTQGLLNAQGGSLLF